MTEMQNHDATFAEFVRVRRGLVRSVVPVTLSLAAILGIAGHRLPRPRGRMTAAPTQRATKSRVSLKVAIRASASKT
jgi:hypothetical protein